MKAIDKLLKKADEQLLDKKIVKSGSIENPKAAAIAGFGAMVINIGISPTLAVYKDKNDDIYKALCGIVGKEFKDTIGVSVVLSTKRFLTKAFVDASVALKIMARTYKIIKTDD